MTKKNSGLVFMYDCARYSDLYQAYKSPSWRKVRAYRNCLADMAFMKGYDPRICSANCHFFSLAFRYKENGKECLRYYTGRNTYDIVLD